jgi:hypothetical protein
MSRNRHATNATLYNNQKDTSNDNRTNGHAKNHQLNTTIDFQSTRLVRGRTEWKRENLFQMADGRAEQNRMAFS